MSKAGREKCSRLWKWSFFSAFSRLGHFPQDFGHVKGWVMFEQHKIKEVPHVVECPIVFILFYDQGCQGGVFKVMKKTFVSVFQRLDSFPHVFMQVRESLILQMHEMKRVLHAVACLIVFLLFHDRDWQGVLLKLMKNDHLLVFFAVWVLFPKFLGRLRCGLC